MTGISGWFANGRLADGSRVDIAVADGMIAAMAPAGGKAPTEAELVDLAGDLVLPGLIDGHMHLDKTFLGLDWMPAFAANSILDIIETEVRIQAELADSLAERASTLARLAVSKGTSYIRTHADVDTHKGLAHVHALLDLRERFRDIVDIQIVAFPQSGVLRDPGTADLLEAAVTEGVDLVGGLDPATIDGDVAGQLDILFGIAERRGVGLDIHLHNLGDVGAGELEAIAERTAGHGMAGKVTASHAYCLGSMTRDAARRLGERMARAGMNLVTAASPGAVFPPPIDALAAAGLCVFAGNDNIRDAWSPLGSADMLERVKLVAYRLGFRRDEDLVSALDLATGNAAKAMGLPTYGLVVGAPADFCTAAARGAPEAVAACPPRRLVVKRGRVVAREGTVAVDAPGERRDRGTGRASA